MDTSLDNANNPFANSNGADNSIIGQKSEGLLLNLSDNFKHNGSDLSPTGDFYHNSEKSNGKRLASEFDDDDDLGPETDVDAVDDVLSPSIAAAKALAEGIVNNNPDGSFNPFVEKHEVEKAALEIDLDLQKQQSSEFDGQRSPREETPTPPADAVHDGGLEENLGDSGEESEDEWNYIKGEEANKENISPSQPDCEVADLLLEEQENMSQLNPNAAEFVPVSPTRSIPSPACRLLHDPVIAQSPKRPSEIDISLPNPQDFEKEVKSRPSDFDSFSNGHDQEGDQKPLAQDLMENLLNGKNIDEIPEFQPGSTPSKTASGDEFHFGPNAAPFTPAKLLDQSEAALSTKAVYGDESVMNLDSTLDTSRDNVDFSIKHKEDDPMSMSYYQEKGSADANPFDLNKVVMLPENIDDFLSKPDDNIPHEDTISDLAEHDPVGDVVSDEIILNNDERIQTTDLDKVDDEKELASPVSNDDESSGVCELSKSPQPQLDDLMCQLECSFPTETLPDVCLRPESKSPQLLTEELKVHSPEPKLRAESPAQSALSPEPLSESPAPQALSPEPVAISPVPPSLSPEPQATSPAPEVSSPEPQEFVAELTAPVLSPEPAARVLSPELQQSSLSPEPQTTALSPEPQEPALSPAPQEPVLSPEPQAPVLSPEPQEPVLSPEPQESGLPPELQEPALTPEPQAPVLSPEPQEPVLSSELQERVLSPELETTAPEPLVSQTLSPEPTEDFCKISKSPLLEAASPEPSENVCSLPRTSEAEKVKTPEPEQLIEVAKETITEEIHNFEAEERKEFSIESPVEDITSSVKDVSSPISSPVPDQVEPDPNILLNFAHEINNAILTTVTIETSSPIREDDLGPEVCPLSTPKSIADTESVATTDVNSFLERSQIADLTSPLSQGDYPFASEHPLSRCVYPLPTEIETENITPEFAEPVVISPTETKDDTPSVPSLQEEIVKEPEVAEKETVPAAVAAGVAAATAAGIAAVTVAATAEKKTTKTKTPTAAKKPATKRTTSPTKPSPSPTKAKATLTAKAKPFTSTRTTPTAAKTTSAAAPKPPVPRAAPKPKTPTSATTRTSLEKKPLANGDVKAPVRTSLTSRRSTESAKPAPAKPATTTITKSPTKPAASRPTTAPTKSTAAKPPSTASTFKPRPTTLASKTTTSTATASKTVSSTTTTSKLNASKTGASPKVLSPPKPRPTTAPAKPRVPLTKTVTKTSADTEKQNKDSANKLTASRTVTSTRTTGTASSRTLTSTVRKTESKVTGAARTTLTKTTTTATRPGAAGKKPLEITRVGSKTKTTKIEKPVQNGVTTIVTEQITIVNNAVVNDSDTQLMKDNSPIDNKLLVDTNAAD